MFLCVLERRERKETFEEEREENAKKNEEAKTVRAPG
jgi:hypothetical protein